MLNGVSGYEENVRNFIINEIKDFCEYKIDNLGNLIAFKKGNSTPKNKVMISAHMDEVGMIVTYINSDGTLKISSVGGVDPRVVFGRQVIIGENNLIGVIGAKAIHNLSEEERKTAVRFDKMYIDIGCENKEGAEKLVSLGDTVAFSSDYIEFGNGFIKAKAIDDRAGCAIMINMIKSELEFDTWFTFVVQEEIGLRGEDYFPKIDSVVNENIFISYSYPTQTELLDFEQVALGEALINKSRLKFKYVFTNNN